MTRSLLPRPRVEVVPGAVHVPDWLSLDEQRELVAAWREWCRPPAPSRFITMPNGGSMSVEVVCLGWHWQPYRYSRTADDTDGAPVTPFPAWLGDLGRRAVAAAYDDPVAAAAYDPDIALVNHYPDGARMGMHQDKDERTLDPVVSVSVGDDCTFRFGNAATRGRPHTDVTLCSGDLFVFGGPARLAYHGVPRTFPGTGEPATGLDRGRLNLTLRMSGLPRS